MAQYSQLNKLLMIIFPQEFYKTHTQNIILLKELIKFIVVIKISLLKKAKSNIRIELKQELMELI